MSLWEGEQPNRIVTLYGNYIDLILCYHKNIFYGPFKYFFYNLRFFIILNMNGHVFWIRPSLITSLGVKVIKKKKKKKDNLFYFTRTIWDGTIANSLSLVIRFKPHSDWCSDVSGITFFRLSPAHLKPQVKRSDKTTRFSGPFFSLLLIQNKKDENIYAIMIYKRSNLSC